ncbi:toluene ABC transporter periplasmic protein [Ameyamaea chiangmaiensis NBRC 103196]|uniref:Outer membrane lipid asymmetry maintenance protein MlaD n=1 Tax=Ameyamaea chiangmaiensis TaxID=442969 RepID=A0A850PCZ8_9PROT|nr:outer membrane lipid asymmetry maintenance protein MlaD [Ameyamaea chiangmaiensis]MBS4075860.1 outer membrane lipid asymmetry maintenance protein MlaD [Ameyamaea chiangmaiensis]NVN42014.1 outer membrane lipid asymmetry maintenance protein MlaD [Ameyamaea chiangmaiensis]GBQ64011.1 toluene ABC transporter periplasmic protein [Ameyamaea chiangmaiensis NBRC 103196]
MSIAASSARSRSASELAAGSAVLLLLVALMAFAVVGKNRHHVDGYTVNAVFDHIDGLTVGSDVRLAGITVGHVISESIDPHDFRARIAFSVRPDIALPTDSAAIITSDSLLGGKYVALSPGGDTKTLTGGATITQTQGSISLEQLLSKFIFSVTDTMTRANQTHAGAGKTGETP